MVFIKILILIAGIIISLLILKYTERIVRLVGKTGWAERYLGGGGTYTIWKIIALIILIATIWFVFS